MANQYFFRVFLPSKGFILNGNQSQILKSAFWTYMMGRTRPFFPNLVYDRFEGLHFLCRFWHPTSIFLATFYLLKKWQSISDIEIRILNVYDGSNQTVFTKLSFTTISKVYTSSVDSDGQPVFFFATFYLLKFSFWMAIILRIWNPHSEPIWWVEQDHFYQIFVYDRFEGLHFLCKFWPQQVFFLRLSTF